MGGCGGYATYFTGLNMVGIEGAQVGLPLGECQAYSVERKSPLRALKGKSTIIVKMFMN